MTSVGEKSGSAKCSDVKPGDVELMPVVCQHPAAHAFRSEWGHCSPCSRWSREKAALVTAFISLNPQTLGLGPLLSPCSRCEVEGSRRGGPFASSPRSWCCLPSTSPAVAKAQALWPRPWSTRVVETAQHGPGPPGQQHGHTSTGPLRKGLRHVMWALGTSFGEFGVKPSEALLYCLSDAQSSQQTSTCKHSCVRMASQLLRDRDVETEQPRTLQGQRCSRGVS